MAAHSANLASLINSDDRFRAMSTFIYDTFVTVGGWVQTADTGQLDISTASAPSGTNTIVGYHIYRMDDAMQATRPLFVKVSFSSGNITNRSALRVEVGTGSDGSGELTGDVGGMHVAGGTADSGTATPCYGSAEPNRCQLALFNSSTPGQQIMFSIERTKDASGQDTAEGFVIIRNTQPASVAGAIDYHRFFLWDGVSPPHEPGVQYVLSRTNPSSFGSDMGVGLPVPFKGVAHPPGTGIALVRSSDLAALATFQMNLYGSTRTYVRLYGDVLNASHGSTAVRDTTCIVCLRYD